MNFSFSFAICLFSITTTSPLYVIPVFMSSITQYETSAD